MTAFRLSENIDKNKVFLVNKSQIEKRLDPFHYVPELMELEEKVWQKNPQKLIHYAKAVSSGATPKTTESEKYYTDKENGIPFLRVQNLTSAGRLKLDNVKFINEETHNGMLARSKVKEGDLLIKITGVGRMAVSSVAPEDFEGNVNQHMVVMKTDSPETSKILAAFLNSDIGEKLASRRATGGTRPALDYPALLSIPIIYDERILKITEAAVKKKEAKEQQAKDLLASIDDYLLGELGITLPEKDGGLEKRIFKVPFSEVSGNRLDPFYNTPFFIQFNHAIDNTKYKSVKFRNIIDVITKGETPLWRGDDYLEVGIPFLKVQNVSEDGIVGDIDYVSEEVHNRMVRSKLKGGEILYTMAGSIGIAAILPETFGEANINQAIAKIILKPNCNKEFVALILNSSICRFQSNRFLTTSAQPNINFEQIKSIKIPIPPPKKQTEMAEHIHQIRQQAKQLKQEADKELEKASREVEQIIIKS